MLKVDARWKGIIFRMRVPLAHIVHGLATLLPAASRYSLMIGGVSKEAEPALHIALGWHRDVGDVGVMTPPISQKNPASFGCGHAQLPEGGKTLQNLWLDEQQGAARSERQRAQHRWIRRPGMPVDASRPGP